MTYEQIAEMMEEMGLPFAYHHFAEGESPEQPFLLFLPVKQHLEPEVQDPLHLSHRVL